MQNANWINLNATMRLQIKNHAKLWIMPFHAVPKQSTSQIHKINFSTRTTYLIVYQLLLLLYNGLFSVSVHFATWKAKQQMKARERKEVEHFFGQNQIILKLNCVRTIKMRTVKVRVVNLAMFSISCRNLFLWIDQSSQL